MKKSELNRGVIFVITGICFILAAVFTESVFDGLLWGFAGGALVPGIGRIIQYFYWSAPKNEERYREIREQEEINRHDELNEKLRDKSGRIAWLTGLIIICISEVVFSVLGKMGIITDHKIMVWYLFGLFVFQILIGTLVYHYLRKKVLIIRYPQTPHTLIRLSDYKNTDKGGNGLMTAVSLVFCCRKNKELCDRNVRGTMISCHQFERQRR